MVDKWLQTAIAGGYEPLVQGSQSNPEVSTDNITSKWSAEDRAKIQQWKDLYHGLFDDEIAQSFGWTGSLAAKLSEVLTIGNTLTQAGMQEVTNIVWYNNPTMPVPLEVLADGYFNGYIDKYTFNYALQQQGYNEDIQNYYLNNYSYKLNPAQWFYAKRYNEQKIPSEKEFKHRFNFALDEYADIVAANQRLPDLNNILLYSLRNSPDQYLTGIPNSDFDYYHIDWNSNVDALLKDVAIAYGLPESFGSVYLDSITQYPQASDIIRAMKVLGFDGKSINRELIKAGYNPTTLWVHNTANQSIPTPFELASILRRWGYDDKFITQQFKNINVSPIYEDVFNEMTKYYPSVQDLITMAVREAFTPDIAKKFGQYESLPDAFVQFAKRAGLDEYWAAAYWASHWNLPSAQQGFDMFHRGIISFGELEMLLRALDVMPFWRDKLIQTAYLIPGRIDIRRMFRIGVYSQQDVYNTYMKMGYSPEDADSLTQFTIRDTLQSQTGLSPKTIFSAFATGTINRQTAFEMVTSLGMDDAHANIALDRINLQQELNLIKQQVKLVKEMFQRNAITKANAYGRLIEIGLIAEKAKNNIIQWEAEKISKALYYNRRAPGSKALRYSVIMKAIKAGTITKEQALVKLEQTGYSPEDAEIIYNTTIKEMKNE